MRFVVLLGAGLLLSSAAMAQMGQDGGGPGGDGLGGGGSGGGGGRHGGHGGPPSGDRGAGPSAAFRPAKPLKREKFDKVVTAMFRAADTNRDGTVMPDELRAVIDGRRESVIRARFARIDRNRDGRIDPAEFDAWQRSMGSVALSETAALGAIGTPVPEAIEPELGHDPDDRALASLIEPLGATTIVNGNVNYDAGITLDELLAYERKRFDAADRNHDGELTADETRELEDPDGRHGPGGPFAGRGRPPEGSPPGD